MAEEGLDVIGGPRGEVTQKFNNVQFLACLESYLTPGYPCCPGYRPRRVLFPLLERSFSREASVSDPTTE